MASCSSVTAVVVVDLLVAQRRLAVDLREDLVLLVEVDAQPLAEPRLVVEVADADAAVADLVGVAGPDALAGGPVGLRAVGLLARHVEALVPGHHHVRAVGDDEVLPHLDAACAQLRDLGPEHLGVDDDAVRDDVGLARTQDARGDQMQAVGLARVDDRVPRVVAALVADDQVRLVGEEVDHAGLALVSPLGAEHAGGGHRGDRPFVEMRGVGPVRDGA
jgi:hypothetical protein